MTDQELKKLFETKLAQQQHLFSTENWARMEAMLDAKPRSLAYYWRSAAAIIAPALLLFFIAFAGPRIGVNSPSESTPAQQMPQSESAVSSSSNSEKPKATEAPTKQLPTTEPATSPPSGESQSAATAPPSPHLAATALAQNGASAMAPTSLPSTEIPRAALSALPSLPAANWVRLAPFSYQPRTTMISTPENSALPQNLKRLPFATKHRLWATAGTGTNNSYNSNNSMAWNVGVLYQVLIAPQWSVSLGMQYQRTGEIGIERLSDSTFFGLGRTDVLTHEHFQKISSWRIPIEVEYRMGKHSLAGGLYFDRVSAVSWHTDRTVKPIKQDARHQSFESEKYHEHFQRWNTGLSIAYRMQISESLQMGLQYSGNLRPTVQTENTGFEAAYRIQQIHFNLRYRLWQP